MDILTIFALAAALGIDCLTVSACAVTALQGKLLRPMLRLALHFGVFQSGMTFLGWFAGTTVGALISALDHWIAFGLLAFVGGRMLVNTFREEETCFTSDPTRGSTLVMLSVATSIDALAVGLSMALLGQDVLLPGLVIGLASAVMALVGVGLGAGAGAALGKWAGLVGGLVLIGIGIRVLVTHLVV